MSGTPYQSKIVYVGQYKIATIRVAPNRWAAFVFDMDRPEQGGSCLYKTEGGFKTAAMALADGQRKVHGWEEGARFRGRWRARRPCRPSV